MSKFNIGDTVKVIDDKHTHVYKVGEFLFIIRLFNTAYECRQDGRVSQLFEDTEIELVHPASPPIQQKAGPKYHMGQELLLTHALGSVIPPWWSVKIIAVDLNLGKYTINVINTGKSYTFFFHEVEDSCSTPFSLSAFSSVAVYNGLDKMPTYQWVDHKGNVVSDIPPNLKYSKCECGITKLGYGKHSSWCPMSKEEGEAG